jgi:hypothetical protein
MEILFLMLINVKVFGIAGFGWSKYLLTAGINYIMFRKSKWMGDLQTSRA